MTEPKGRLLVVLSTERSGSTLLSAILGGSQRVLAPPEMHLFRFPDFETWKRAKPGAIASFAWLMEAPGEPASEARLAARFTGRTSVAVYRELLGLCSDQRWLVDKTPAYVREPEVLRRIETLRLHYLWLVRHPLGVLASALHRREQLRLQRRRMARTPGYRLALGIRRAYDRIWYLRGAYQEQKIEYWCLAQQRIKRFLDAIPQERRRQLHFERLVRSPSEELQPLCRNLGIELAPAMLHPERNVPSALVWGLGNEKTRFHSGIDARVADRWRERFDASDLNPRTRAIMQLVGVE